jgi:UDP-N-acetyl-D-mannosaminuronic acid dehydrogenase
MKKKICIIGQGYIGIPTAMILSEHDFTVVGVDKDSNKIDLLNQKKLPFHESEFTEFSKKVFENGNYSVSTEVVPADVFIICVPTPFNLHKACDYDYVESATESIVPVLKKGDLVILESTVPPKTCEDVLIPILETSGLKALVDFHVSHAPERLLPGNILHEIIHNDRIIGGVDEKSTRMTFEIYKTFSKGKILKTDAKTAEMCKLMENTFRDVNIALANEFALICEKLHINTYDAIEMANYHPRVSILNPGPGVGGHCIPIDPWFIVEKAPETAKLIRQARLINDAMPNRVADSILEILKTYENPIVTLLGVAYKPDVDDARESPSKYIVEALINKNVAVKVCDPLIKKFNYPLLPIEESLKDSDCIIYVVNHKNFKDLDPTMAASLMRSKNIFISGNFSSTEKWDKAGFNVKVLGISKN